MKHMAIYAGLILFHYIVMLLVGSKVYIPPFSAPPPPPPPPHHHKVNHLGHFLLTLELLPLILSSAPDARVVIVSSSGHRIAASFDPTNLQSERGYDRLKQYCNSKLYNVG